MLVTFDETAALAHISSYLTASQQTLMVKQKFNHALSYLLLRPQRYILRQYSVQPDSLKPNQFYSLVGKIRSISKKRIRKNLIVYNAVLNTELQVISLVWFNQNYILEKLKNDPWVVVFGKYDDSQMSQAFQVTQFETYPSLSATGDGTILPIYPDIRGISNRVIILIIKKLLAQLAINDLVPDDVLKSEGLISAHHSFQYFHFPAHLYHLNLRKIPTNLK